MAQDNPNRASDQFLTKGRGSESAELLSQFHSSPYPKWIFDVRTFAFLAVNEAAVRRYGFSQQDFLSMTILDIRPSEDIIPLVREELKDRNHNSNHEHWRHRTRDGRVFEVDITSRAITFHGRQAEIVLAREVYDEKGRADPGGRK